jgi:hypothetical protein
LRCPTCANGRRGQARRPALAYREAKPRQRRAWVRLIWCWCETCS